MINIEGVRIRVGPNMSRRVEQSLAKGLYEREQLQLIDAILTPDDIVLEVGAGLGLLSTYCAKRVGSSQVFAFEADPELEPCIRETYSLNGVDPVLEMCAVGARAGRVTLFRDKHLVSSSVGRRRGGNGPVEVPGKALNYVIERVHPTLLIVDAEGAERGLFDHAELGSVTRIVLELHDRVLGPAATDQVRAMLAGLGFEEDRRFSSPEHVVLRRAVSHHASSGGMISTNPDTASASHSPGSHTDKT
jgi:FkbM family methyltransferase